MTTDAHRIELLIPNADGPGTGRSRRAGRPVLVPFESTVPPDGWQFEEGEVRWTVGGVALLDGSFGLYPWDQLLSVVATIEAARARREARVNVPGSIITLFTRPAGSGLAAFGVDIPARRVAPRIRSVAEQREIVARTADVRDAVVRAARAWMLHIPPVPPPRPQSAPGPIVRRPEVAAMIARLDALAG